MTKDQFDLSHSDQRSSDPSGQCNALSDKGRESGLEGRQVKIEDANVANSELEERVSITDVHEGEIYPHDMSKTSFQAEEKEANTAFKIKQEDTDDDHNAFVEDNHDGEDGIIGGFLEDSDGESVHLDEHFDRENMPGSTIDTSVKVWLFCLAPHSNICSTIYTTLTE